MGNFKIPVWNTKIPDETIDNIKSAFNERSISTGKYTYELEKTLSKMHQDNYVICVNSGTSALKCIALALNLKSGDEIIIPRRSWVATANAFYELGLKIKFAEVDQLRSLILPESVNSLISNKTKAIVTVNLNGKNSLEDDLLKIVRENSIPLIQDNAQSLLSSIPNKLNDIDTLQAYSFSIAKLITTGQGGCVITSNKNIAEKLKRIRTQGVGDVLRPGEWDIGSNYRISDLLTSIGLSQIKIIHKKQKRLLEIFQIYKASLSRLKQCSQIPLYIDQGEYPLYSEFLFDYRNDLISYLDSRGIETRPFYRDLDTAHYLKDFNKSTFSESVFSKKGLTLPGGDGLSSEQQEEVIEEIFNFYKS